VARRRTRDDLDIVAGEIRSFEWFWASDETMPGRDAYEELDEISQDALIAAFRYWSGLPHGKRISETRVNEEHADPKIFAVKAGKHRFTVFHGGDEKWVVHRYYPKAKKKLDKAARAVIRSTIDASRDYDERVRSGRYYERT
jgi:hypothetical protein